MYSIDIPRVPKKRNGGFSVPCRPKMSYCLTSLDKTSSAEENDTKIVKFGLVILSLCTLFEIQSFSYQSFAGFLGPMSEEFCRDKQSIYVVLWKPIVPCLFCCHGSTGFHKTPYGRFVPPQFSLTGCKNPAKFDNDRISRNGHRIKIAQSIGIILFCGRCFI